MSLVEIHLWSLSLSLVLLTGLNPMLGLVALGLAVENGLLLPREALAWTTTPYMLGLWSAVLAVQVIADLYFMPATVQDRAYLDPSRVVNAYLHSRLQSFGRPMAAAVVLAALPLPMPSQTAAVLGFVTGTVIYRATAWVREHVAVSRGSVLLLFVEVTKNGVGLACAALVGWAAPVALALLLATIAPMGIWAARLRRERLLYPPYGGGLVLRKIHQSFEPRELGYPANLLSLTRLALVWPTVRYLLQARPDGKHRALACILAGMATDAVDGHIARSRNEVSDLGMLLDPIADKLTLDGIAVALSIRHGFPWWVTYLLLGRDVAILTGSTQIFRSSSHITPSIVAGKITTAALTATLLLYILDVQPWARRMLIMTLIPLAISWVQYGMRYYDWLGEQ